MHLALWLALEPLSSRPFLICSIWEPRPLLSYLRFRFCSPAYLNSLSSAVLWQGLGSPSRCRQTLSQVARAESCLLVGPTELLGRRRGPGVWGPGGASRPSALAWEVWGLVCTTYPVPLRCSSPSCFQSSWCFFFISHQIGHDPTRTLAPSCRLLCQPRVPSQRLLISAYSLEHKGIKHKPLSSKLTNVNGWKGVRTLLAPTPFLSQQTRSWSSYCWC